MEKAKILAELIEKTGMSVKAFSVKCGIPYTTLYTILKKGVGGASVDNIIIICKNLGIKVDDLEMMADGTPIEEFLPTFEYFQDLVARNGKNLTTEQKQDIIKKLLSED